MSSRQQLPEDQRTVLALLIDRGMTYESAAGALGITPTAVRDRAHGALAAIAPDQASDLDPVQRGEIGDYMLGQQSAGAQDATRQLIESSAPASAWAHALSQSLGGEDRAGDEKPSAAKAGDAAPAAAPASRARAADGDSAWKRRNAVVFSIVAVIAIAAIIVAVVLNKSPGNSLAAKSSQPTIVGHAILASPSGAHSAGLFELLKGGSKLAYYVAAVGLAPTHGFYYALWMTDGPGKPKPLNRAPSVGSNGRIVGGALLPTAALKYHEVLLTRETQTSGVPSSPGETVLKGKIDYAR
jgi:hypothetical protein